MKLKLLLDLSLKELRWLLKEFRPKIHLVFVDENGDTMTDYSLKKGSTATIPLLFKDANGVVLAIPTGVSVSSSDTNIAVANLSADSGSVQVIGSAAGSATLTAAVGAITGTLNVTVTEDTGPQPGDLASIEWDVDHATVDTGATPAPAPAPVVETGAPVA